MDSKSTALFDCSRMSPDANTGDARDPLSTRARYRLEYLLYRATTRVLSRLSPAATRRLGSTLGASACRLIGRLRRRTEDNLRLVFPDLSEKERRAIGRASFSNLGAAFLEELALGLHPLERILDRMACSGLENLEAARARSPEVGVLILSAHFGAFDLVTLPLSRVLGPLLVVARPVPNPRIAAAVQSAREAFGLVETGKHGASFRLLKALKRGQSVGFTLDQRVSPWHGVLVPFLGHPAWTSTVPAQLSQATGAAVLPVSCVLTDDGGFLAELDPPIFPDAVDDDDTDDRLAQLTTRYVQALERRIRDRPELWMWGHRRWQRIVVHDAEKSRRRVRQEKNLPACLASSALPETLQPLAAGDFLEAATSLYFCGSGSPAAAASLANTLVDHAHAVRFVEPEALASDIAERGRQACRDLDRFSLVLLPFKACSKSSQAIESLVGFRTNRLSVLLFSESEAKERPPWLEAYRSSAVTFTF